MNKAPKRGSWRKIAAWAVATTLAFGLLPASAFADTANENTKGFETEAVEPAQAQPLEAIELDNNVAPLGNVNPLAARIAKSEIDATKPGRLSLNDTRSITATKGTTKYFRITLDRPSKLNMIFSRLNSNADTTQATPLLRLYALKSATNTVLQFDGAVLNGYNGRGTLSKTWYLTKGTYYLQVEAPYASDTFNVTTKTTKYTETFSEAIPGSNENGKGANRISFGKSYTGLVTTNNPYKIDVNDFYKFSLTYDTNVVIKSSAVSGLSGSNFYIYKNKYKNPIAVGQLGKTKTIHLAKGTYYIYISDYSEPYNGGRYTFNVTKGPKLVVPASTPARLTWATVPGADKYEIWRSADGGKTFKRTAVVSSSVRSQVVHISAGNSYLYKIRAIDGNVASPWSISWEINRLG
jgi:hypothetical protein